MRRRYVAILLAMTLVVQESSFFAWADDTGIGEALILEDDGEEEDPGEFVEDDDGASLDDTAEDPGEGGLIIDDDEEDISDDGELLPDSFTDESEWMPDASDPGNEPESEELTTEAPERARRMIVDADEEETEFGAALMGGECGTNLSFTFTEDGTLTISGSGDMFNFSPDTVPWSSVKEQIRKIVFDGEITGIGTYAFYGCSNLLELSIPKSVNTIEANALRGCTRLNSLEIPFTGRSRNVTSGYEGVLGYIFGYTMNSDSYETETRAQSVPLKGSDGAWKTYMYYVPYSLKKVSVTDCEQINPHAFYSLDDLTEIILPDNLKTIGEMAFEMTYRLDKLHIPGTVVSIGENAFRNANRINVLEIDSVQQWMQIDFGNIYSNPMYISLNLRANGQSVTSIHVTEGVSKIKPYAFYKCKSLTSVNVSNLTGGVGENAFYGCENLQEMRIDSKAGAISRGAFEECTSLRTLEIGEGITLISTRACYNCSSLTEVRIPKSVYRIDQAALQGCNSLVKLEVPFTGRSSSVSFSSAQEGVLGYIFGYTLSGVSKTDTDQTLQVYKYDNGAWYYYYNIPATLREVTVTNCTSLNSYAFKNCKNLTTITLPENLRTIESGAFDGCTGLNKMYFTGTECKWSQVQVTNSGNFPKFLTLLGEITIRGGKGHSFTNYVSDGKASCTRTGLKKATCDNGCGASDTVVEPKLPHQFGPYRSNKDVTCTQDGTKSATCEVCGYVDTVVDEGTAMGHQYEEAEVVATTDTQDGYTKYVCADCGDEQIEYVHGYGEEQAGGTYPESDHRYRNNIDKTYTYTEPGAVKLAVTFSEDTFVEDDCDQIYLYDGADELVGTFTGNALAGKTIDLTGDTVKIRLTSDANTTYYGFKVTNIVKTFIMHEFAETERTESTCSENGHVTVTCAICGGTKVTKLDRLDHTVVTDAAVEATCTTDGLTEGSHCSVCGEVLVEQEVVKATGHTVVTDEAVEATCTDDGLTEGSHCSVCDEVLVEQEVVKAIGHTAVTDEAVAATCTTDGLTEGSHCSVCGEVLVEQEVIEKLGHTVVTDEAVAATCTADGLTEGSHCSVCGEVLVEQEVIEKLGHTVVTDKAVAATCTADGLTEGSHCSVCGEVLVEQEVVEKLGHTVVTDEAVEATCTDDGLTEGSHCSVCNEVLAEQEVVEKLGHTWTEWEITVPLSGSKTGTEERTCSVCGEKESRVIPNPAYKITYVLNSGTNAATNPTTYYVTQAITLAKPTRSGYAFIGWYSDKALTKVVKTIPKGSTGDKTFYAKWERLYKITYVLNSGTNSKSNPATYHVSSATIKLASPTRKGYAFMGWYSDKACKKRVYSIPKGSTGNKTVYAKWEILYKITYVLNGGTNSKSNPATYHYSTPSITLVKPTKKGYTFKGWFADSKFTKALNKIPKGSKGAKTFYAKWAINTYKITYTLNGGKLKTANPATYRVTTPTFTLYKPTRTGYTFLGWYKESTFKTKVGSIAKGSTGNLNLYAKWKKK